MSVRKVKNAVKDLFGISDWTYQKKRIKKSIGRHFYKKKYNADELIDKMASMGMEPGDIVFLHSSMMEFYNYQGTGEEFIEKLIAFLGPDGTLAMPAFPKNKLSLCKSCKTEEYHGDEDPIKFDVRNTPTGAGYLPELFRKMPGVKRSINIQHSVCAIGKWADYLTCDHHLSLTAWDEKSPYYRLTLLKAKVFSLGLPSFVSTVIHCTESMLYGKYEYFDQFFDQAISYNYLDENGKQGTHNMRTSFIERHPNKKLYLVKNYFEEGKYLKGKISNLSIRMADASYTLNRFMELAEQGIVMYSQPNPRKYSWTPLK